LDEFVALGTKMKADGLTPIAFAQKQGWPALGTFDQLNFRINGYEFHMNLMAGKEDWAGKKVRDVFDTWRRLMPLHQENALGRTWEEAAQSIGAGKSGMYLLGMFVGQQFSGKLDDLDFFPFPEINSAYGTDTVEAPIDGFMLSRKAANPDRAKKLLTYLASASAQLTYIKSDPSNVAANTTTDTSGYNSLQRKALEIIGKAKHITQFLDRDTDPRFASDAAINGMNKFLQNPNDIDGVVNGLAGRGPGTPPLARAPPARDGAGRARPAGSRGAAGHPERAAYRTGVGAGARLGRTVVQLVGRHRRVVRHSLGRLAELRRHPHPVSTVLAGGAAQHRVADLPDRLADRGGFVPCRAVGPRTAVRPDLPERAVPADGALIGHCRLHLAVDVPARPGTDQQPDRPRTTQPDQLAG
jgi:hypothetical protein